MQSMKEEFVFSTDIDSVLRGVAARQCADIPSKSLRMLNIACEYTLVPSAIHGIVSEENAYGIEINPDIVRGNSHIKLCDVNRDIFPFSEAAFDLVLSVWGMEHFQGTNIFREVSRVLATGGVFIFVAPNVKHPIFLVNYLFGETLARFYYKRIMKSWYTPHKAYYQFNTFSDIQKAIAGTDLEITEMTYFGPANILGYFSFSHIARKLIKLAEKLITNRYLYRYKPAFVCVLRKSLSESL